MGSLFIVNPNSASGTTGDQWPTMEKALKPTFPDHHFALTNGPGDATSLAHKALREGIQRIVVVGGDGTINETINGFFEGETLINPDAELGLISSGTGGDFRKTFGLSNTLEDAIAVLQRGRTRAVDVGRISLMGFDGKPLMRHFNNIASFGMSGTIMVKVNNARFTKRISGTLAFYWATLSTMIGWKNDKIHLTVEGGFNGEMIANTVHVANGEYSGSGMHFAPMAKPDDGIFDVVVLGDFRFHHLLTSSSMLYNGTHVDHPLVQILKGRKISARSTEGRDIFLEVDGETPGKLPATFEAIPKAINLIC